MPYNKLLKNLLSLTILVLLVLSAYFTAAILSQLINMKLTAPPKLNLNPTETAPASKSKSLEEYLTATKELFPQTSTSSPTPSAGIPLKGAKLVEALRQGDASKILLKATLVGDLISLAVFEVDNSEIIVKEGESLGEYKAAKILKNAVQFTTATKNILIPMHWGEEAALQVTGASSSGGGGLKKSVTRRELTAFFASPDKIRSEVNFAPISKNSKPYGIQINFLQPGSFLETLGLQLNDILVSANDKELHSPEDAFTAYQMMRNEDEIVFKVDRGGKIFNLTLALK
jgi:type II secretion system protein C